MKILMIAPEPFFEPRGTPFSELFRIKALLKMGHQVDLVTYPLGSDVELPGLRIFRTVRLPFIKKVKVGPSLVKLLLDFFLLFSVLKRVMLERYDLLHTHEEAAYIGIFINKLKKIPHLYDMHSSLVQQLENFRFSKNWLVKKIFLFLEKRALRNAAAVIVICPALYEYASGIVDSGKLVLIENFLDQTPDRFDQSGIDALKSRYNPGKQKLVLYTGTLEPYQGIDLLIKAFALLPEEYRLLIVGGSSSQLSELRKKIEQAGIGSRVELAGQRPAEEIPYFLKVADILVSPRIAGTNTPLKIYSYLKSGAPLVATNLYTHRQALNDAIAILVDPDPASFAEGIRRAAGTEGRAVMQNALEYSRKNFSQERYEELVSRVLTIALSERKA